MTHTAPLNLISQWFIAPNCEAAVIAALEQLAVEVLAAEPDTLSYLVHIPFEEGSGTIQSHPPSIPRSVLFFESYRTPQAFLDHVQGPVFKNFVAKHGAMFVSAGGHPFTTVSFLTRVAGFTR